MAAACVVSSMFNFFNSIPQKYIKIYNINFRFNEESSVAMSGSHDNTVMCWDLRSRKASPIQVNNNLI